ncbi:hypothetical protein C8R32_10221 [Nitrosospira sp. Nsp5]|uniref:DNA repair ATPase n=1 Tax=Nitrosospira multiformis TaxID=1231 RepID=A0ABY0TLA4_9PROT|nr:MULTISPECIES: DNA repair protein [Nitrosospira]PTR09935.1 hypothetical protein C8R32_10221 [Nitrosospira sp. Nsp5]SDR00994.1 hypothetical protein SAMN05216402_3235 [Nitrosospira multiformis]
MGNNNNVGESFRIRRGISIGEPEAESDGKYLSECFINTGDYETLVDLESSQRIIIGRTGVGKSALIYRLKQIEDNVIEIQPADLSLNYISNSDFIRTLENAGVKLDIFYILLWKHVFAVELLKSKYDLVTEEKTKSWISKLLLILKKEDQAKERALTYLREWGDKFWKETEYRIVEVTQKLENDIKSQMGADYGVLELEAGIRQSNSVEVKSEYVHKAQNIVNSIQIKALSDVMKLLAEDIFDDPQEKRYIVIDKLDETWIDSDIRYRLIRALIETIKSFRVIPSVKIIIALRQDLIQQVFDHTRDAGFQEEKYKSLFLNIRWQKSNLVNLINKRVVKFVCEPFTSQPIALKKLFPERIDKTEFYDYLLGRTLFRPRDAIAFVNLCLIRAQGREGIAAKNIKECEMEYSAERIDALKYEWINHYPKLDTYFSIIEKMPSQFKLSLITATRVDEFVLKYACDGKNDKDPIIRAGYAYLNNQSLHNFIISLTKVFFNIGVFGIKPDSHTAVLWNYLSERVPTDGQIKPSSVVHVHPMLWARLGIASVS